MIVAKAGTSPSAWLSRDRPVSSNPCGVRAGPAWPILLFATAGNLLRRDASQWDSLNLQASRSFRQVRCRDDRGSYPRPEPKRYRL